MASMVVDDMKNKGMRFLHNSTPISLNRESKDSQITVVYKSTDKAGITGLAAKSNMLVG